jgi:hypothetical protein
MGSPGATLINRKTNVSTMKIIGSTSARRVSAYRLSEVPLPPAMDASCLLVHRRAGANALP